MARKIRTTRRSRFARYYFNFITLFLIFFLMLSYVGGGPVLIALSSINNASTIPHLFKLSLSKVLISQKTTLSPNSPDALFALSYTKFWAGHQPLKNEVTFTLPGIGSGFFFNVFHRGTVASSVNGFHNNTAMPSLSAFL